MSKSTTSRRAQPDGTIEESDGRYVLRFERRFAHPIERVWDAITRPERIGEWIGEAEVEIELVEGGRMDVRPTGPPELLEAMVEEGGADPNDLATHQTVLRVEPPRLFEHDFGGDPHSIVRWELHPDGDGCRLTLTHRAPPGFDGTGADGPRDLAGWHTLLDHLGDALDGRPAVWTKQEWEAHRDRYAGAA